MNLLSDYLLVHVEQLFEDKIGNLALGGVETNKIREDGSISYNANSNKRIYGTIVSVPSFLSDTAISFEDEGLPMYKRGIGHEELSNMGAHRWDRTKIHNLYYPTAFEAEPITLQQYNDDLCKLIPGNRVYFNYLVTCEENMVSNGVFKIRLDEIICTIIDGAIQMIAGYVLLTPEVVTEEQSKTASGIYTQIGDKPVYLIGTCRYGYNRVMAGKKYYYLPDADWRQTIEQNDFYVCKQNEIIAEIKD